jgi:hypothetical protein
MPFPFQQGTYLHGLELFIPMLSLLQSVWRKKLAKNATAALWEESKAPLSLSFVIATCRTGLSYPDTNHCQQERAS